MELSSFLRKTVAQRAFHTTRSDGWFEHADTASGEEPPEFFFNARSQRRVGPVAQPGRAPVERHVCSGEAFSLQRGHPAVVGSIPAGPVILACFFVSAKNLELFSLV